MNGTEALSAVLDQLARPADEQRPDWGDVVSRARRESILRGGSERPRPMRLRHSHLVLVIAVIALAAAGAAVAIRSDQAILNLFDPPTPPEKAEEETGTRVQRFNETFYDGFRWAVLVYRDGAGRICYGAEIGSRTEGTGAEYSCRDPQDLFRTRPGRPREAIQLVGPAAMQEPSRRDFDRRKWDKVYFYGLAVPEIARLEVVMTTCSHRPVMLDAKSFEGNGVFLFTVPREDLQTNVWPYRLIGYDQTGTIIYDKRIPGLIAPRARVEVPRPAGACR